MKYSSIKAVKCFEKVVGIKADELDKIFESILSITKNKAQKNINILDIGSGTGLFSIPFAKYLKMHNLSYSFTCIDHCEETAEVLTKKIEETNLEEKFKIISYDLENNRSIQNIFSLQPFDIIICTRTLHQLNNWRFVLDQIIKSGINIGSIFVFSESGGDIYRSLNFDINISKIKQQQTKLFSSVLNKYFKPYFSNYKNGRISAVNMGEVISIINNKKNSIVQDLGNISWHDSLSWNDYISAIENQSLLPFTMPFMNSDGVFDDMKFNRLLKEFTDEINSVWTNNRWCLEDPTNEQLSIRFFSVTKGK